MTLSACKSGLRRTLLRYALEPLEVWVCLAGVVTVVSALFGGYYDALGVPEEQAGAWVPVWGLLYCLGCLAVVAGIGASWANVYAAGLILFASGVAVSLFVIVALADPIFWSAVIIRAAIIVAFAAKIAALTKVGWRRTNE